MYKSSYLFCRDILNFEVFLMNARRYNGHYDLTEEVRDFLKNSMHMAGVKSDHWFIAIMVNTTDLVEGERGHLLTMRGGECYGKRFEQEDARRTLVEELNRVMESKKCNDASVVRVNQNGWRFGKYVREGSKDTIVVALFSYDVKDLTPVMDHVYDHAGILYGKVIGLIRREIIGEGKWKKPILRVV